MVSQLKACPEVHLSQAVCCRSPVTSRLGSSAAARAFPDRLRSVGRAGGSWADSGSREGFSIGKRLPKRGTCLFCWSLKTHFHCEGCLSLKAANARFPFFPLGHPLSVLTARTLPHLPMALPAPLPLSR